MTSSPQHVTAWGSHLTTDPYLDPETGILRNLVGATDQPQLSRFEADLSTGRMIQVQSNKLVSRTNDSAELVMLHKHLFGDIYEWAGQVRTIDMTRDGGEFFAPYSTIELNLNHVFSDLSRTNNLRGLSIDEFTHELARFYDDLNYIHPFRDGNGRTQRLFWSRVSADAGWVLDWREVYGETLNEASRTAREARDLSRLEAVLRSCIT